MAVPTDNIILKTRKKRMPSPRGGWRADLTPQCRKDFRNCCSSLGSILMAKFKGSTSQKPALNLAKPADCIRRVSLHRSAATRSSQTCPPQKPPSENPLSYNTPTLCLENGCPKMTRDTSKAFSTAPGN